MAESKERVLNIAIHALTHPIYNSFTYIFIHLYIHSLIYSFIHSFIFILSLTHSPILCSFRKINQCTTAFYEGMIALVEPQKSWVAKWQRFQSNVPGRNVSIIHTYMHACIHTYIYAYIVH